MKILFWSTILLLAMLKLSLMGAIPLSAVGYNIHDDTLFLRQAGGFGVWLSELSGQRALLPEFATQFSNVGWLGQYNELILCKGPVYGLWIALCLLAGIPLFTAQNVLYIAAGIVVVIGLRKVVPFRPLLLLIFAVFLFNPEFITRVLRAGIYPALSVLIMAALVGLYANRYARWKQFAPWALLAGCVLPLFWMTREEGIWLLPSIFFMLLATLISIFKRQGFSYQFILKCGLVTLPFLMLYGGTKGVALLNKHHYGVETVVELKSDAFLEGYGALLRVKHPPAPYVVVPSSVRKQLYAVSPAFQELELYLEGEQGKMWQKFGCQVYPETCGEIAAGWFLWAFRDAVALSGYHQSGHKAAQYYRRLATEIDSACRNGTLDCRPKRASLSPHLQNQEYVNIIANMPRGLHFILQYKTLTERLTHLFHSVGEDDILLYYQDMTGEQLAPAPDSNFQSAPPLPIRDMLNNLKLDILTGIAQGYRTATFPLFVLASFLYLLSLVRGFRQKQFSPLCLFATALLIGIGSRIFILSYIDVTSFQGYSHSYLSPLYPFLLLFITISFVDTLQQTVPSLQRRNGNPTPDTAGAYPPMPQMYQ